MGRDPHPRRPAARRDPSARIRPATRGAARPARRACQRRSTPGAGPTSCPRPQPIRAGRLWRVAPMPADLQDRRVEITGPVDRKMIINALNSGANVFMADFEDSNSPTWENCVAGPDQPARRGRGARSTFTSPDGKQLHAGRRDRDAAGAPARLAPGREAPAASTASRCSGALFDFGLYFFHNAERAARARRGPVLLPAQAGEPPRGAPLERRLRHAPRTSSASRTGTIRPRC